MAKLNCLICSSELGLITKNIIELSNMKAVSKIDIDTFNGNTKLKCSRCDEWNSFVNDKHSIDTKRKGKEVLEYKKPCNTLEDDLGKYLGYSKNGVFYPNKQ